MLEMTLSPDWAGDRVHGAPRRAYERGNNGQRLTWATMAFVFVRVHLVAGGNGNVLVAGEGVLDCFRLPTSRCRCGVCGDL